MATASTAAAPAGLPTPSGRVLPAPSVAGQPLTALAPMQDVTDLPFMRVIGEYGAPDYFFTEFLRVHAHSRLDPGILDSVTRHGTGRPVFAQLIGEDIPHMVRTVRLFDPHPVAGIDLNMGCPAPKVYKKNVGGGLLRDPAKVDDLLAALREACDGLFTVKMRIGFEDTRHFDAVLESVNRHRVDLLSVHGRTVKEMYRSEVHYDWIRRAREAAVCPVLANGNVATAADAARVLAETGCAGVMIGRGAIRNPWIFRQIREYHAGRTPFAPTLADAHAYVRRLWDATHTPDRPEAAQTNRMKKFLAFIGQGVDPEGAFLHEIRRTRDKAAFFDCLDRHLLAEGTAERPFSCAPYPGLVARPNRESAAGCRL